MFECRCPWPGHGGAGARRRAGLAAGALARSSCRVAARGVAVRGQPAPGVGKKAGPGDAPAPYAGGPPFWDAKLERAFSAAPPE